MSIMLVVAFLVIVLAVCFLCEHRECERLKTFGEDFPPISDEEFLARCTPGTNPRIALKVRKIVSEQLSVEYDRVYPSSRFIEDLRAD